MLRIASLRRPARRPTELLNLGCGVRRHPAWTNADLVPDGSDVHAVDVRRPLPFASGAFAAVYASHLVEHLAPAEALALVRECHRVLRPGGVLRVVVPDLEGVVRAYLASLEAAAGGDDAARWRHRWMTVELLDQLVRRRPGGLMRRWWSCDPVPCRELIEARLGTEATAAIDDLQAVRRRRGEPPPPVESILHAPPVPRREARRLERLGERHQWMYDRLSLAELLHDGGFGAARRVGPAESAIAGFPQHQLDADALGRPHKPDSLYMEARRP